MLETLGLLDRTFFLQNCVPGMGQSAVAHETSEYFLLMRKFFASILIPELFTPRAFSTLTNNMIYTY